MEHELDVNDQKNSVSFWNSIEHKILIMGSIWIFKQYGIFYQYHENMEKWNAQTRPIWVKSMIDTIVQLLFAGTHFNAI